ncbi:MAG: FKBP-type peptidyl-prolyl cis-trans isomerase [Draconibacterium sp.]
MKKAGIHFIVTTILSILFASCLKMNDIKENTEAEELINLNKYLTKLQANGNDIDTTTSGVYYITINEGTGDFARNGDTLSVGYAGYFIDGTMFGSSFQGSSKDSTFTFILDNPPSIQGWDDGMKVMKKNAKTQLIIPSSLAYGSEGAGIIPAYQTLVFVVVMKNIKPEI